MKIVCEDHGEFTQAAYCHLAGNGCPACKANKLRITQAQFLERCEAVHGRTYDYSKTVYKSTELDVEIICRKHGKFSQNPRAHYRGNGCARCADESLNITPQEFIGRSQAVHGDKYDYSETSYVEMKSKVDIKCKVHGTFSQRPFSHVNGSGCPKCPLYGYSEGKRGTLYILESSGMVKIGITNRDISFRLKMLNSQGKEFKLVAQFTFENGQIARDLERKFLKTLRAQHQQPAEKFDGSTECFYGVDVNKLLSEIQLSEVFNVPSTN